MQVRLEKGNRVLTLIGKPLGHGGEAVIHPVQSQPGLPSLVAKIYHRPTPEHAVKLAAMIANPPVDPMAAHGHTSITWPSDRVFSSTNSAQVVGYVMARIDRALPMAEFFNPKARLRRCPLFHFGYLLRTAHNLTAAVHAIHEAGYVVGDLNESNCLVNNQALVTLVDTDSFQVPHGTGMFRCPVGKPEYTAPELQGVNFGEIDRAAEHDNFALAVLIFQILMQGFHPYAGKFTGAGEPAGLPERIGAGYWPYGPKGKVPYVPNPHAPPLEVLPTPVQALMHLCFEKGHKDVKSRPGASAWQDALRDGEKEMVACSINAQHLYPGPLGRCPWCALARRQGRDAFPSIQDVHAGRFGLRRIAAKLRKPIPRRVSQPVARAAVRGTVPTTAPMKTLAYFGSAQTLGPLHPPAPHNLPAGTASLILFAVFIATVCGTLSAAILVIWTMPPAVFRSRIQMEYTSPLIGPLLGAFVGAIFGYMIGRVLEPADSLSSQLRGNYSPSNLGGVFGTLSGSLGGVWGWFTSLSDPVVLAGNLGNHLGVMGLALAGGGLGGFVVGLLLGLTAGYFGSQSNQNLP